MGLTIGSLLLLGGAFLYLLYGFISGYVSHFDAFPLPAQQMILYKFSLALKIFEVGFCLLLVALCLRYIFSLELGFILLLIGLFLYLGVPFLFGFFYLSKEIYNPPLEWMISGAHLLGEVSLAFAGCIILLSITYLLLHRLALRGLAPERETTTRLPLRRTYSLSRLLKPCWDTPYCRDFLREFCPAYSKKRSCWKAGGGCLCDEAIVNRLLSQTSVKRPEGIPTLTKTVQLLQKKLDCGKCPIYAEHQRQKYQIIAPLIPLFIIAIFWFGREGIHNSYFAVAKFFDDLFSNLAYLPTVSGKMLGTLTTPWLETTILVIIALLLIGILLHLLEYLIFSLNW